MDTQTSDQAYPEDQARYAGQARPVQVDDDEISLIDLVATLLRHKRLIIGLTAAAAVGVLLYAIGSINQ